MTTRYARFFGSREAAVEAAVRATNMIRTDWDVKVIENDNYSCYNVIPYQRYLIDTSKRVAAIVIQACGEIAARGEDRIGEVVVRHAFAYQV